MSRKSRALALAAVIAAAFILSGRHAGGQPSGQTEVRTYQVRIDKKPAGVYQLTLALQGSQVDVQSTCDIDYRILFFHYRYTYRGHEKWQGARLLELNSECSDDGKRCRVSFAADKDSPRLSVNGQVRPIAGNLLASSYWSEPRVSQLSAQFLEVDTGRVFTGNLKYLGDESLLVDGQSHPCKHYRVSGGDQGDLWYDRENRLVQQTTDGDGHPTFISLQHIDYRQLKSNAR